MGSAVSIPTAVALSLITGAIVYGFVQSHPDPPQPVYTGKTEESTGSKKGKKKKAAQAGQPASASSAEKTPVVVPFPAVVPGGLAEEPTAAAPATKPKSKKKKAKKAANASAAGLSRADDAQSESSATAPESSTPVPRTKRKSPPALEADGPWTRVESRKRPPKTQEPAAGPTPAESIVSDPGITTSVTGTTEPTDDEREQEQPEREPETRRPLAERLLPKPRKTGVEDLLETPDVPTVARVMRVKPGKNEQPAEGFSWGDYEDVDERGTAGDMDGEDDGGWIVKSSNRRSKPQSTASPAPQTAPESMTKKQRQNKSRNEAAKAAKEEGEKQRLQALEAHQRELRQSRIVDQYASGKKVSGGMKATVSDGHFVFE